MSSITKGLRLKKLRELMKNTELVRQSLHAYIVPCEDAHQSEVIASQHKRLEFISGFSGSKGTAIITEKEAALWADGRYYIQASKQLGSDWILMKMGLPNTPSQSKWLNSVLSVNSRVGFDPYLVDYSTWKRLSNSLQSDGHTLVPVSTNLIDVIWEEKPMPVLPKIDVLPLRYAGMSWQEKVASIQKEMTDNKASVLVISALDEVAWLFNLRGADIDYSPLFFSYAVLALNSVHLFVEEARLSQSAHQSLNAEKDGTLQVCVHPYENIGLILNNLLDLEKDGKLWISPLSSYALVSMLPEERRLLKTSPVAVLKAVKNEAELSGAKNAHIKDAVALCEFFAWLSSVVPRDDITEVSAAEKLGYFRSLQSDFVSLSFETISSSGPNGSVIHYRPKSETDRPITTEELYLCDSGGQYLDGTTDVTRTLHFGVPTPFQKVCYTLVLKGQIGLSSAKFPLGVKGNCLDAFARRHLWEHGLDYPHGTGHGVGAFLNVHEGPISISRQHNAYDPGFQPGMILSIEPGYYEDEQFGIRLENLVYTCECKTSYLKQCEFLTFESLTLVPYQAKMIEPTLLTPDEVKWINDYHNKCREVIGSILKDQGKTDALDYLMKETLPLG